MWEVLWAGRILARSFPVNPTAMSPAPEAAPWEALQALPDTVSGAVIPWGGYPEKIMWAALWAGAATFSTVIPTRRLILKEKVTELKERVRVILNKTIEGLKNEKSKKRIYKKCVKKII